MNNRTDLAIEFAKEKEKEITKVEKIGSTEVFFTILPAKNEYKKKAGKYITLSVGKINKITDFSDIEKAIIKSLKFLLPDEREKILVIGLGNREITSDCIGPYTAEKIFATRHIIGEFSEKTGLSSLKSVSVLEPGVLGKTGIETYETVEAVVKKINPDAIIVIDALCANNTKNLFSVIQFTNTGISPGSGVKNSRKELSFETLGIPTVAIGVPTVVYANIIAKELNEEDITLQQELLLTPKDTDLLSHRISEIIGRALNIFLQPNTDREILLSLV